MTEFLDSLLQQDYSDFEVVLGDGTPGDTLRPELQRFVGNDNYPLTIIYQEYLPVSDARNEAAKVAKGEYFIFLDSDCLIPPSYLPAIDKALAQRPLDLFGGPDAARDDFSDLQKSISFAMTSTLTTGGIRGKKKHVGTYHPRGFNMGISRRAFEFVNGYDEDFVCGEDVELSIRIIEAGFKSGFIPEAHVYHKRRTTLTAFFNQVFRFGAARIELWKKHPKELKLAHFFPAAFMLYTIFSIVMIPLFTPLFFRVLLLYCLAVFVGSSLKYRSLSVAFMSVAAVFAMNFGYGYGFLKNALAGRVFQ